VPEVCVIKERRQRQSYIAAILDFENILHHYETLRESTHYRTSMTDQRIYYFTNAFPFGAGQQWKANELAELVRHFTNITVVSFSCDGNCFDPKPLPPGVTLKGPLFEKSYVPVSWRSLRFIIAHPRRFQFLREFFLKKVYKRHSHFVSWLAASLNAIRLLKHPIIKDIIDRGAGAVLHFYWGRGACEFLPFVDTSRFHKIVIRMHGYDLFEYRNDGYIPYRAALLDKITIAAPGSNAGVEHLRELYPGAKAEIRLVRCGTINRNGRSPESSDSVLRVVSCSYLVPVKRVHLMIEALEFVDFPIVWRHLGGGALMDTLTELVRAKGLEDKFLFEGNRDSGEVLNYLTNNRFDLFVNTSASEGVPISIMEALSVGIPVMATDVGGSGEIVHEGVGALMPADLTPQRLAEALTVFYELPEEQKRDMRNRAYQDYLEKWDAQKLSQELAALLKS
jgi:glycosyltransferase involved in cell wall biosynthesis